MGVSVNVSERSKKILEGIRDYHGYKSMDAALRKTLDEADVDEAKFVKIGNMDDFGLEDYLSTLEEAEEDDNNENDDNDDSNNTNDEDNDTTDELDMKKIGDWG